MSSDLREQIVKTVSQFSKSVEANLVKWAGVRSPEAFRAMELEIAEASRCVGDEITGAIFQDIVADPEFQTEASLAARHGAGRFRHGGVRKATVTLLGGREVQTNVEYLKPNRRHQPGRRRRNGRRGRSGVGLYPVLAALGIWFGVTPALAGEVCCQVTDSDSARAGRAALARRGVQLGHERTLNIVNKFSRRAVAQRDAWLARARANPATRGSVLCGRRVVIAADGGRLRERVPKTRGRRLTATGHHRYDAPWREPKLLTIYVVGRDGKVDHVFQPVYDGTMGNADALFDMLVGYLKVLGVQEARELVILGDGAIWIWERAAKLVEQVGIAPEKVTEIIDKSHAVSVVHEIAEIPAGWPAAARKKWLGRARRLLRKGDIDGLVARMDELAVGRRATAVKEHRSYFVRNAKRMQYAAFEAANLPIGSGAIESAIRRIVNLRMKSNGQFWIEPNAEGMLLLRSYLKSGYFDTLIDWSIATAAAWWRPAGAPARSAPPCPLGSVHSKARIHA